MTEEREKVLVIDDEAVVRSLLQRVLTEAGYDVVTAADGQEGLAKASEEKVSIVLTDIRMPVMSGMEVLRKLALQRPRYCVVMVTAIAELQSAIEALQMGAYDYITKPFDQNEVKQKVDSAIAKWQRDKQEAQRYDRLSERVSEQAERMKQQFNELVASLAREHRLLHDMASKQADHGRALLSKLPLELREPTYSAEQFRDALLRLLKKS